MSYLDVLLGKTGPPAASLANPQPRPALQPNQPTSSAPASRTELPKKPYIPNNPNNPKPGPAAQTSSSLTKRKADIDLESPPLKIQRNDVDSKSGRSSTTTPSSSVPPGSKPVAPPEADESRGVSGVKLKRNISSSTKPRPSRSTNDELPKAAPVPPPPKGSFRDIMNRAKAIHERDKYKTQTPLQHKTTPVLSVAEHRAQMAARKNKTRAAISDVRANGTASERAGIRGSHSIVDLDLNQDKARKRTAKKKEEKEALRAKAKALMLENRKRNPETQSTYKGTMRGPSTTYQTSMNLKSGATKMDRDGVFKHSALGSGTAQSSRRDSYASITSDDENSMSDASSDMEADVFDVDKEEQRALKAAKLEDAQALKEENDLKRRKMERKRALDALKASRARNAAS